MRIGDYWTTEDANPCHVYHDVLIALDETRRINNGQQSLWAKLFDQLNLAAGAHVVHVGAGAGYYIYCHPRGDNWPARPGDSNRD